MIIAVYSAKGGVGKTTLAVNLAWASSALSKYRTLLWDLDAQGGASYILRQKPAGRELRGTILQNEDLRPLVRPSSYPLLDVLPTTRRFGISTACSTNSGNESACPRPLRGFVRAAIA